MIDAEIDAEIRRLHLAEHWKAGTIASNLGVHPDAVRRVLRLDERKPPMPRQRPRMIDPFLPLVRETLERYPRLRATNIHAMLRERGFAGSARQVRRAVHELRPRRPKPTCVCARFQARRHKPIGPTSVPSPWAGGNDVCRRS